MGFQLTGCHCGLFAEHGDDVRAIVQRAVKDLSIEHSLKTYEEVWLSKLFELKDHVRNRIIHLPDKPVTANQAVRFHVVVGFLIFLVGKSERVLSPGGATSQVFTRGTSLHFTRSYHKSCVHSELFARAA